MASHVLIFSRLMRFSMAAITVAIMSVAMSGTARADSADQMVQLMNYPSYYDKITTLALEECTIRLKGTGKLTAEQLTAAKAQLLKIAINHRVDFLKEMANAYRSNFTSDELSQLLQFYGSPLGRKLSSDQVAIQRNMEKYTTETGMLLGTVAVSLVKAK